MDRSYRLSYRDAINPTDPLSDLKVRYFANFAQAQQHIARELLSEYSSRSGFARGCLLHSHGRAFDKDETETIG